MNGEEEMKKCECHEPEVDFKECYEDTIILTGHCAYCSATFEGEAKLIWEEKK